MSHLEDAVASLAKRAVYCPSGTYWDGRTCQPYSSWYWWGRWVLTGVVIISIAAVLLMLGCISARRRRRRGIAPLYGTGWMGPKHGGPPYQNNPGGYYPPPPQYTPAANNQQTQYTGSSFDPNQGYWAGHNEGVQPPQNAHVQSGAPARSGEDVYAPPPGPPPGK